VSTVESEVVDAFLLPLFLLDDDDDEDEDECLDRVLEDFCLVSERSCSVGASKSIRASTSRSVSVVRRATTVEAANSSSDSTVTQIANFIVDAACLLCGINHTTKRGSIIVVLSIC